MITARVLPPEEWHKIANREPYRSGGLPNSTYWRIVVVERDGKIVASSALFDTVHWDCFEVDPEEQGNPAVFKQVIAGGLQVMQEFDIQVVHTTVPTGRAAIGDMLERFGFHRTDGDLFYYARSPR